MNFLLIFFNKAHGYCFRCFIVWVLEIWSDIHKMFCQWFNTRMNSWALNLFSTSFNDNRWNKSWHKISRMDKSITKCISGGCRISTRVNAHFIQTITCLMEHISYTVSKVSVSYSCIGWLICLDTPIVM